MNLGFPEMLFLMILALLIFGPRKLPDIGKQIGKALSEFRRASHDFKMQIEDEVTRLEHEEKIKKAEESGAPSDEPKPPSHTVSSMLPTGAVTPPVYPISDENTATAQAEEAEASPEHSAPARPTNA